MTAIIMREKTHELKEMLGKALDIAEQMCEGEMGERGGYGNRYGERSDMGERGGGMGMRDYPDYPMDYGERRGVRGTGRYSRY